MIDREDLLQCITVYYSITVYREDLLQCILLVLFSVDKMHVDAPYALKKLSFWYIFY